MNTVLSDFRDFWNSPFKQDGSVTSWFLFTGLILCAIFLWSRVLKEAGHIVGA